MSDIILEPAAQEFADATAKPPLLYELGVEGARKLLDDVQSGPVEKLDVDEKWITVPAQVGDVRVRIVRPVGSTGVLPVILYVHGGGWILGNAGTHDRLVRELAVGAEAAVVFVEYDRSPEAAYPVALEQGYATARWITANGAEEGLDAARLVVAGDSVGGNMAAALAILAKQRGDVRFLHQSLYYPVTDAGQDTASYTEFAERTFLLARSMAWFWDCYLPDVDRLLDGSRRRGGLAQRVEHHEVVDRAVVADTGGADAGLDELARVGLALVAEHVVLVDDDKRLGQAGELLEVGPQR